MTRIAIEHKSIDYIPEHERHGRAIDQASFWFLGNFHFFTIAIGFVGPSMGLGFGFTSLAGALGAVSGQVGQGQIIWKMDPRTPLPQPEP